MRDLTIINTSMDGCIVLHDVNTDNPIILRIDYIMAITKDKYDDIERCIIHMPTNIFSVSETMDTVMRRIRQREV